MKLVVKEERCPKNHFCPVINVCPKQAIVQKSPFDAPLIEDENCSECGICTNYCAYGAITYTN